ncbi:hypothetical protein ACFY4C_41785 [Actinomadura viridis]|uniref:hypothetical protein n=1 Tax=Actinomadura viridis TaxID=58110 RepID=UPI0036A1D384
MNNLAIPLRCAQRPQVSGMVVPWTILKHPHAGFLFGQPLKQRVLACIQDHRCQICGEPLADRVVIMCRQWDLEVGYAPEPGMHPECANYSAKACPMLNGRMSHYRTHSIDLSARICADPHCVCRRWADASIHQDDQQHRAGRPAGLYGFRCNS